MADFKNKYKRVLLSVVVCRIIFGLATIALSIIAVYGVFGAWSIPLSVPLFMAWEYGKNDFTEILRWERSEAKASTTWQVGLIVAIVAMYATSSFLNVAGGDTARHICDIGHDMRYRIVSEAAAAIDSVKSASNAEIKVMLERKADMQKAAETWAQKVGQVPLLIALDSIILQKNASLSGQISKIEAEKDRRLAEFDTKAAQNGKSGTLLLILIEVATFMCNLFMYAHTNRAYPVVADAVNAAIVATCADVVVPIEDNSYTTGRDIDAKDSDIITTCSDIGATCATIAEPADKNKVSRAFEMKETGKTTKEIAKMLEVNVRTVQRWFKDKKNSPLILA